MHANRNKKAVKRVEKGMMKANRIRNLFAVFAIVLTTFMITTVFSLGINYMENMKLMQVRTAGTTANASLAMPTEKQEQQIKNLEYVKTVGTQYMVGSVAEKNDEGRDLSIALSYYDTTEWDKHYKETIKDIEGKYPSNENEIMLSEDALSQLGMKEPKLNMEIPLSYYDKNGQQEKNFTLSGWFHSYTGTGMGFVSEAYCKNAGYTMAEDGVLSLSLNKMPDDFYRIQKDVELNENQSFGGAVSMKSSSGSVIAMVILGFQGCLGYDYHKDTKSISVNEKEAEIVRYIFNRYIEGAGCTVIANELENLGYKTKYGSSRWVQSTVIGIIKNEKYKGDLLLGKTFTVDPISKRRLENFGEEDKFYIRDHHEAIISEEIFEEAQKILAKRNVNRGVHQEGQKRNKFSRKYAFSCMIKCGFCGGTLSRRNWHSSSAYTKTIWHCVTATKHGKKNCPHCKGIPEEVIENAFVKSYQLLCSDQHEVVSEFLQKVEDILKDDASLKRLPKIEKEMTDLQRRKEKLLDLRLDNNIDRDIYDKKNQELSEQLKKLQAEQLQLVELSKNQESTKTRIREFRKNLNSGELLESFDRVVFESVVERIIIGGYNDEGVEDPLKITFVYKTGIHSNLNAKDFKPKRKNAAAVHTDAELCSYASVEDNKLCLHSSSDTCGDGCLAFQGRGRLEKDSG